VSGPSVLLLRTPPCSQSLKKKQRGENCD
jgi:hypothetical protein